MPVYAFVLEHVTPFHLISVVPHTALYVQSDTPVLQVCAANPDTCQTEEPDHV